MFTDYDYFEQLNNSVNPALYFHAKNGFSGDLTLEITDHNLPTDTQIVISSVCDHVNWLDVPDYMTPDNFSELAKLKIPL